MTKQHDKIRLSGGHKLLWGGRGDCSCPTDEKIAHLSLAAAQVPAGGPLDDSNLGEVSIPRDPHPHRCTIFFRNTEWENNTNP